MHGLYDFQIIIKSIFILFCYSPHPYIFFNHDRVSMTFLGFLLSGDGNLLNPATNEVLEQNMMDPTLRGQLKHQGVDFDANYEKRDKLVVINACILLYHCCCSCTCCFLQNKLISGYFSVDRLKLFPIPFFVKKTLFFR